MPQTSERAFIRVVLLLAGLAGLFVLMSAIGRGDDQRELYDRVFLYLPTSSFLLVVALASTDVVVGLVARRAPPDARVVRSAIAAALGVAVAAGVVVTSILLWFR